MGWIICFYCCTRLWIIFYVLQGEISEECQDFSYSIDRALENEVLATQENYKLLKENFSQKCAFKCSLSIHLTFEYRKEEVFSIQNSVRSKEQQCENKRLRVEQVVDSITNTAKISENEVIFPILFLLQTWNFFFRLFHSESFSRKT